MKAIRFHRYGGPEVLVLEEVSEPSLDEDGVLIDTVAASINPIDWKVRSGARQHDFPLDLPAIPGRDISGVVRAVGAAVQGVRIGDRVIAMANETYAEVVAVPAALLAALPDEADPVDAAALPLAVLTGDQLVREAAAVEAGQTVLITGALGSVGRAAVHAARRIGATVIAGVRARQRTEADALGVDRIVALDDQAAMAALGPLDAVADTVGGDTGARALAAVRDDGRFGYASVLADGAAERHPSVRIARVFARPDAATLTAYVQDWAAGSFVLPVSRRLPLGEAAAGQAAMERGGGGKIVLTP